MPRVCKCELVHREAGALTAWSSSMTDGEDRSRHMSGRCIHTARCVHDGEVTLPSEACFMHVSVNLTPGLEFYLSSLLNKMMFSCTHAVLQNWKAKQDPQPGRNSKFKINTQLIFRSISNLWAFIYQEHIWWGNMKHVIFDKQHKCSMPAALYVLPITSRSVSSDLKAARINRRCDEYE